MAVDKEQCILVSLSINTLYKYKTWLYRVTHFIHSTQNIHRTTPMSATRSVIVLFATVLVCKFSASKTSKLESVLKDDADGERLVQLGTTFNNSMLKLVGHTFENLEETVVHELCHKTPCTLWSDWTHCTAKVRYAFGYQTRLRKCWYNSTEACAEDGAVTIETASKVCEGQCRSDYTISKHGFCLKLVATVMNQSVAEKMCQSEGGHLINVDTQERLIDYTNITKRFAWVWADGLRANIKASFRYHSGVDPFLSKASQWQKHQPSNVSSELCLTTERLSNGKRYWHDVVCNVKQPFVCEIR